MDKRGWRNVVLVDSMPNEILTEAAAGMKSVDVHHPKNLDVYTILHRRNIILTLKAVEFLEDILCEDDRILVNKFD